MGHLSQLMDYESGYIEDLKRYIYNAQRELDFLRNTLDEIENERKLEYKSEKEKTNHLKYPLNQFRLIRRFDNDWPDVTKVIGRIKSLQVRIRECRKRPIKVGCVFPMVIWSELRMRQYRKDDHRESAPHFSVCERCHST